LVEDSAFEVVTQRAATARALELLQSLGLDLTNTLTRNIELLADLFQGVLALLADAEALLQNTLLTHRERIEQFACLLIEICRHEAVGRARGLLIFDEVAEGAIAVFTTGGFEAERLLHDAEQAANLADGDVQTNGQLFGSRLTAELL